MSTLFAFFHHVAAFTLVSALAVEFILIGQEFSLATARRLVITDAVLGGSAAILIVAVSCACSSLRRARTIIFTAMHS